ncbi:MAG: PstS family phosphate ABC transporter substrate-binding protein [Actinomycetota bacterium]
MKDLVRRLLLLRRIAFVAALAVVAAGSVACGGSGSGGNGLTGTILADGSSTVFLIAEAFAEEFKREHPGVDITVGESGTGGGFKKFCNGETDISDASRPISDEEKAACKAKGIEFVDLEIARDGLSVVVNNDNTWAKCLTVSELKKIWEPNSKITNWKQIRSAFPDQKLKLYGPGTASGTFDYFTKAIVGVEKSSRTDYSASEDDNVLVTGVAGDKGSLGYFGYAYFSENRDKLNIVGVDSGSGCVTPSDATVRDGTYSPLSRPLFIYVKKSSIARPEVKAFVEFALNSVNGLLPDIGYTALSEAQIVAQRAKFEKAA